MKEKQSYEKHLAEKLESLPPPGDSSKNWPAMKAMLDQQMPKTGGSWWIYGIIIAVFVLGTWFFTSRNNDEQTQIVQQTETPTVENKTDGKASTETTATVLKNDNKSTNTTDLLTPGSGNENISNEKNTESKIDDITSTPNSISNSREETTSTTVYSKEATGKTPSNILVPVKNDQQESSSSGKTATDKRTGQQKFASSPKENLAIERNNIKGSRTNNLTKKLEKEITDRTKVAARSNSKDQTKSIRSNTEYNNARAAEEEQLRSSPLNFVYEPGLQTKNIAIAIGLDSIYENYANTVKPLAIVAKSRFKESTTRTKNLQNRVVGTGEDKNFVIGLTLPLSMPLGDQRVLAYNSTGGNNTVLDYVPSPNLQYHISQSSYVQAEIQIASPQYIQPVLLTQSKYEVPGQQGSYRFMTKSVFARKLYYFNLPIGINYSPFKNFYLGTGLQFSSLMSGIGLSETRGYNSIGPSSRDTLFNANYFKFGNDTLSGRLNSSEVRLTLDANYYWKKFTLGLRYNQALNNYVSLQVVPNTPVFTDKNKALQIYLRYNLWEDRKKRKTNSMARR